MGRRGSGDGSGMGGMAAPVIGVAINLLVFVILEIFAPTIAGTIEAGQPSYGTLCSNTNATSGITYEGACGTVNPVTGVNFDVAVSDDAMWNPEYNSDLPTGASTWTVVMQIIGVVFLVIAIAISIYYLKGMA